MDGQLKRGLLEVCVLAAIKTGDSYGYQIIKSCAFRIDPVYRFEASGGGGASDGPHCGAQRPASEVLSHYRSGAAAP